MEFKKVKDAFLENLKKDKAVKIVLVLGICGIALIYLSTWFEPGQKKAEPEPAVGEVSPVDTEKRLEAELARIVRAITGEEDPAVMVTLESTGRTVYAADEKRNTQESGREGNAVQNSEENEKAHIILKDAEGAQHALTVTEIQPKIKGVVIVSRYAGDPVIREKLTDAVRTALDVSSAKVCVTDSG